MTLTPHGSRNPTAAMAEPATASQPTNSVTRAASRRSPAMDVRAALAFSASGFVAAWPAHDRAGAGAPAGSACTIGGSEAPGASGRNGLGAGGRATAGNGTGGAWSAGHATVEKPRAAAAASLSPASAASGSAAASAAATPEIGSKIGGSQPGAASWEAGACEPSTGASSASSVDQSSPGSVVSQPVGFQSSVPVRVGSYVDEACSGTG